MIALVALITLPALLAGASSCGDAGAGGDGGPDPTGAARDGIPSNYLTLYRQAGQKYGIPWWVLAGIGKVETDHGRLDAQGVKSGANFAGAAGPMQIGISGAASDNWSRAEVGIDANEDGKKDVHDPEDAIPGAARYLKASGAKNVHDMIFSYNHAEWYVAKVMANARSYAGKSANQLATTPNGAPQDDAACSDGGGVSTGTGKWKLAPAANRPGVDLTPKMRQFVDRMAGAYRTLAPGKQLVLTGGTNHSQYSSSGNVSDHWAGNAGDFGMVLNGGTDDGPVGDRIAAAAFMAAGLSKNESVTRARQGGAQTVTRNGLRVQIIWKSDVGGNHHNHVHVGTAER